MSMTKYLSKSISSSTKNAVKRVCILRPMESDYKNIELTAGCNTLGRSKETGIRDPKCSKRQLELDVDTEQCKVKVKVLGLNPCGINGLMAMQTAECELEHGDVIELCYGKHPFEVTFKPTPEKQDGNVSNQEQLHVDKNNDNEAAAKEKWDSFENGKMLVFTSAGVKASEKVAAYDIDNTIIKTKSGNVFPKNIDDWELNYSVVPGKLKRLHQDGYKICFFTNQGGIAKGKVNLDEFKQKIRLIIKKLGVPVQVFIAIADGYCRKPLPGMWEHLQDQKNDGVKLKLEKCFYVGDAAGRPEIGSGSTKRKKDHSLVDRFFASNVGISFYTPEEHFLGKKTEPWTAPDFEPSSVHDHVPLFEPIDTKVPADKCEIIVMVGLPGSGKSRFVQQHLAKHGFTIANADTLGSTQACIKACEHALRAGKSCVVDNTNVDVDSRKKFIDLATKLNVPCRCFLMNVALAQVKHNLAFRLLTDTVHVKVNEMILNMMKKKYKAPTLDEGFAEIVKVNLKPEFDDKKQERLYKLYLVEK